MGSRDASRWVFKLTADPICPPLIPEWYLSLLEFYIVSSASKSALPLSQIVILLTSHSLGLSQVSGREHWLNCTLHWWRTPNNPAPGVSSTYSSLHMSFPFTGLHFACSSLSFQPGQSFQCDCKSFLSWPRSKHDQNFDGYLFLCSASVKSCFMDWSLKIYNPRILRKLQDHSHQ